MTAPAPVSRRSGPGSRWPRVGLVTGFGQVGEPGEVAAFVRHAEDLGFESLWLTEHVVVPLEHRPSYPYTAEGTLPIGAGSDLPDPFTWLSFAAAHTRRISLGSACTVLPLHRPATVAKAAATLDRLSGGRVHLGVGLGWMREEAEAVGAPWEGRPARLEESVREMRSLWGDTPSESPVGPVNSLPAPAAGTIPIHVCGPSDHAVRRAARWGDGWFTGHRDPEVVGARIRTLEAALQEAGRARTEVEVTSASVPRRSAIEALAAQGVDRVVLTVPCRDPDRDRRLLDRLAALLP